MTIKIYFMFYNYKYEIMFCFLIINMKIMFVFSNYECEKFLLAELYSICSFICFLYLTALKHCSTNMEWI